MIFYNSQLMRNKRQLRLFLVSNPVAFTRFEDHRAALEIQIYELIERSLAQQENPIALIEEYLRVSYNGGNSIEDIAAFLIHSAHMTYALQTLSDNWDEFDSSLPEENSLLHGKSTIDKSQAVQFYCELSLTNYLEALSTVYND